MLAFNPPPLALITSTIARPLGAHRRVASRMTELVCAAWLTGCVTVPDVVEPPRMESACHTPLRRVGWTSKAR